MKRAENAQRVAELRAQGMTHRQVADALGLSYSYAAELAHDPTARRKLRGARVCSCGKPMTYEATMCAACNLRQFSGLSSRRMKWTKTAIIEAIRKWETTTGDHPKIDQWVHATAETPSSTTVIRRFGAWNTAIAAAGYEPRRRGWPGSADPAITDLAASAAWDAVVQMKGLSRTWESASEAEKDQFRVAVRAAMSVVQARHNRRRIDRQRRVSS